MSATPHWWSEPVAATGSAESEGIKKQLGAPRMDALTVLVRESAQNSWDARRPNAGTVCYGIDLLRPDSRLVERWRALLCPQPPASQLGVDELLASPGFTLAVISDRGTQGLGGPLRSNEVREGDTGADFVNLLRNIGKSRSGAPKGGTYGFGKGVLFTASTVGTILVRTRCRIGDRVQTRLMGATLGDGFHRDGTLYTGRHWWADTSSGIPDPILDDDAEAVSAELGLPHMKPGDTGTDIVIVGPDLGLLPAADDEVNRARSLEQAAEHLASAMMWNLWPLMLDDDGPAPMRCHVTLDGERVPVPSAQDEPCIRPFVDAYRTVRRDPIVLRRKWRGTDLGSFAACAHIAPTRVGRAAVAAPFTGNAHHCARMRGPRQIVDYLPGPQLAEEMVHYGAVFLAAPAHEKAFADSEPPTHDDWVPQNVADPDARSVVNRAHREVKAHLAAFADRTEGSATTGGDQPPLGALAGRLSALIPTAAGPGADGLDGGAYGGGGGTASRVRMVTQPRMVRLDGSVVIVADIEIVDSSPQVEVVAKAAVALDTGEEAEPPAGAAVPDIIGFRSSSGRFVAGARLLVGPDEERRWTILVRPIDDAAVRLKVSIP